MVGFFPGINFYNICLPDSHPIMLWKSWVLGCFIVKCYIFGTYGCLASIYIHYLCCIGVLSSLGRISLCSNFTSDTPLGFSVILAELLCRRTCIANPWWCLYYCPLVPLYGFSLGNLTVSQVSLWLHCGPIFRFYTNFLLVSFIAPFSSTLMIELFPVVLLEILILGQ